MARFSSPINPDNVERSTFGIVPAGTYLLQIVESDVNAASTGRGEVAKFKVEIVDGEFHGRLVWGQMNVLHESPKAQLIGQQELTAVLDAIGHTGECNDTELMHYRPFLCRVTVGKNHKDEDKNEIKWLSAKPASGAPGPSVATARSAPTPVQTAAPAQRRAASVQPPAGSTRPWGNRAAAPAR